MARENSSEQQHAARAKLDLQLAAHTTLAARIFRQLLVELHSRQIVTVDQIYEEAHASVPLAPGDSGAADRTNEIVREYAIRHLSAEDIDAVVQVAVKREEADGLSGILSLGSVSFRVLADKVRRFCGLPPGNRTLEPELALGIRVGLIREVVSDQLEFIGVAKHYLTIRDFDQIIQRIVGPEHGIGRIGGKAAGMFLLYKILTSTDPAVTADGGPTGAVGRPAPSPGPPLPIAIPESHFLRSDVIDEFLELNGLNKYQNHKYKSAEEIRAEYPLIRREFAGGRFPATIVERLRGLLRETGNHPLIVRSSSLLEDRFGTAFSGKYASVFLPNQNPRGLSAEVALEARLSALLSAVAEIYASALGPDPLLYRRAHDLVDYPEDMGVLIQKVVGFPFGRYFLPAFSGVAFSRNEYRWSPRIRREDGLLRIVAGLGTRAVERVGQEYPRMVAPGEPTLRPESSMRDVIRNAQRSLDVIDLAENRFASVTLDELLAERRDFPLLDQVCSIRRDQELYRPAGTYVLAEPRDLVITFDKLLSETPFAATMRELLRRAEAAYRRPVDIEFTHDGERLYVLQCRPQTEAQQAARVRVPDDVSNDDRVFSATRFVRSGVADAVEYVIYVSPEGYDAIATRERRVEVGRVIGALNDRLHDRSFVLIGPGRWGSNDIRLGVPVTYADINHAAMLIEVARERDGYVPEVSYGTHFFQDLVESDIHYLPLYPDDSMNHWNAEFFNGSPNRLAEILPRRAELADVVRVIRVPDVSAGRTLRVVMDGTADRALAYFA
ncbi:MAG: PEP/pyruvate-binding domain-containing protein [Phycisphaerae bacterium]